MKISLYDKGQHVGGDPEDEEALLLKAVVKNVFLPARGTCPTVWLFFDAQTGSGAALACGCLTLKPGARSQLWHRGVGVQPVPTHLHQTLLDFGPESLRWDGRALVVDGH